ncbi:MAG: TetR family transcriptional regulator [Tistrella sp.]|nr:TetR family transcriptional regulator [uncultured Tistrella sp.]MAM76919.1 TetR family transcriptional regulator [Tistrella sp.]
MPPAPPPRISLRKRPQQARSEGLVAAILEAAVQVLTTEGAQRFTTARVAERAGVAVGSLYQYFPNKAAILFRLQSDEWQQTSRQMHAILSDTRRTPADRLRDLATTFLRSECEEAAIRRALDDAAPLYRDAPEAQAARARVNDALAAFMREALPEADDARRALTGEVIMRTLKSVGKDYSETPQSPAAVEAFGQALGEMLVGYLDRCRG